VAWSPDGQRLAVGKNAAVKVWDVALPGREARQQAAADGVLGWHRGEGQRALAERHGFGALWHFDRLIAAQPEDPAHWGGRSQALAELGQWDRARAEGVRALELGNRHSYVWYTLACLHLQGEDLEAYRRLCSRALETLGKTTDPVTANNVAWLCLWAPDALPDFGPAVRLARQAVGQQPGNATYLNTLGAALYRAGELEEAIQVLHKAAQAQDLNTGTAHDWLFLAMAHARLGKAEEARSWLDKARGVEPSTWQDGLELRLLRQEAEQLLAGLPR
jgi:Flp pilus assembly protein TadD